MSNDDSTAQKPAAPPEGIEAQPAHPIGDPQSGSEIFFRYSILMETSLTLSKLLLLVTAFLTVFLSWLAGAEPVWIVARGVIVTLAMGMTLWAGNWFFTQRVMETVMADAKKVEEQGAPAPAVVSTVEKRA
jgi:hypothetical protein